MNPDTINRYLKWFIAERGYQEAYHTQKENMAWVATALYVPGIVTLGYITGKQILSENTPCWITGILTFVIVILLASISCFVWKQFDLRLDASATNKALMKLVNDFCRLPEEKIKELINKTEVEKGNNWPEFVRVEIKNERRGARSKITWICTDVVSYVSILIATITALCLVWFLPNCAN